MPINAHEQNRIGKVEHALSKAGSRLKRISYMQEPVTAGQDILAFLHAMTGANPDEGGPTTCVLTCGGRAVNLKRHPALRDRLLRMLIEECEEYNKAADVLWDKATEPEGHGPA